MLVANEVCGWVECRISRFLPTYIYLPIYPFYVAFVFCMFDDQLFAYISAKYRFNTLLSGKLIVWDRPGIRQQINI